MFPTIAFPGHATSAPSAPSRQPAATPKFRLHNTAVVRTIGRALHSVCLRLLAWQLRRMNKTILGRLDDRSLRDIGLHRSGIEAAVRDIDATVGRRHRAARLFRPDAHADAILRDPRQFSAIRGG